MRKLRGPVSPRQATLVAACLASLAAFDASAQTAPSGEPTEKSGVSAQAISMPQGAGKVEGLGESFTMQLSTGTGTLKVPVSVPAGRGGMQPALALSYSSAGGRGIAGQGWSIGAPFIARQTDRGTPRYADPPAGGGWTPAQDRFVTSEGHELVPIGLADGSGNCPGALPGEVMPAWAAGWQYFRPAVEGELARYFWSPDHRSWRVQAHDGKTFEYGVALDGAGDTNALEADPLAPANVFRWNLARAYDAHGAPAQPVNVVRYRYLQASGIAYLSDVYDTPPASGGDAAPLSAWAHHVHLGYATRPDPSTSYRRGYASIDSQRLVGIDVTSANFGGGTARELVRRYHLSYDAAYHVSLLTAAQMEGRCASPIAEDTTGLLPASSGCPTLPAMTFQYSHVAGTRSADLPGYDAFDETPHSFAGSPGYNLDAQRADLFDVNADGLPDVLVTDVLAYGANLGVYFSGLAGTPDTFTASTASVAGVLDGSSASLAFSNHTVVPLDLDGAGIVSLLQMPRAQSYAVYTPALVNGAWVFQGRAVATADQQSTLIDFLSSARATRTMDVDGDGVLDVVVTNGSAYQTFFGLARYPGGDGQFGTAAWTSGTTASISTQKPAMSCEPWSSQAVPLGDDDQKSADMNGDGLPDIVRVRSGSVLYWPGRGNGFWGTGLRTNCPPGTIASGRSIAMTSSPTFAVDPGAALRLRDVNGDGLDDLVQLRPSAIDIWLNVDGAGFTSKAHTIQTAAIQPNLQANGRMRFADVNGSGTTDLVWGEGWKYQYVDLAGGSRPWLLTHFANGLGKTTDLTYSTSTAMMEAARAAGSPWTSTAPIPIHVLSAVTEKDTLAMLGRAPASYVRQYTYRDAVYDGREREFRGFRSVHEVDVGDAGSPTRILDTTYLLGECVADPGDPGPSPCTSAGMWRANPREALKGLALLTEKQDAGGHYLSTDHTTYRLRRLYTGLDGRDVRHAFAEQTDTYLYDTGAFASSPSSAALDDVRVELGSGTTPTTDSVTVRAAAAHVRRDTTVDVFGNVTSSTDEGCVDGCASADEAIVTTDLPAIPAGDSSGWLWRTAESSVTGPAHPGRVYRHTRSGYSAAGDALSTQAELVGTLPLDRHHEDPSRAIAPAPAAASSDGWILVAATTYDAFGNSTATRSTNGRCHQMSLDPAYAQLVVTESVAVGAPGADGCGTTSLSAAATFDRGLSLPTMTIDVHGEMTTASYDGFGRLAQIHRPDPSQAGLVDAFPSESYEYVLPADPAATPWSAVHVTTHDARSVADAGTTETWTFHDGFGRRVATLRTGDPSAGDGGPWIVSGVTEYDREGHPRRVERDWFYAGAPLALPAQSAAPTAPWTETRYDAFGRPVQQLALDGSLVAQTVHHALSSDVLDALDLAGGADPTPATTVKDGHGRVTAVTERLHVQGGKQANTQVTSYSPAGDVESVTRTTDSGPPPVVRWMVCDSLGRRVLNVEPDTATGNLAPGAAPSAVHAWRYAYDDEGDLVGTSDARGCGVSYFYDAAGRVLGEDYSPCLVAHAPYTPADPVAGTGLEVAYRYDAAPADAPPDFTPSFLGGRLAAIADRASESLASYDGRGRRIGTARRLAAPDGSGYTPRWYEQSTAYDTRDRVIAESTGAWSPELLGSDGASVVSTTYAADGHVAQVGGSYGTLVSGIVRDARGLVLSATMGDAASTTSAFVYDGRDRLAHAEARRAAPAMWSAAPPVCSPAPDPAAGTQQLLLEDDDFTYDVMDRPVTMHDGRDPAEWPAGAKPVDRAIQYDDLGRVTGVTYTYPGGSDPWVSPTEAEEQGLVGGPTPMPRVAFGGRVSSQSYGYDWLGNVVSATDDADGFYDRSLGTATLGGPASGPYQLVGASDPSANAGGLAAAYDAAGNMTGLVVTRSGTCLPAGATCSHRFVYDWDEAGRLVRARRWDLASPGAPTDPLPEVAPAADVRTTYDAPDTRVLKAATDASGTTRYTAYVFSSLELRQTTFEQGDYVRDATTEVARLFGHGVPLAEVRYEPADVPTTSAGRRHVELRLADHLGSTGTMVDKDTGELVEATTYLPFGARESDYRPHRWDSFREPYGFTGKEEDVEVGLTYFGRRFLAPALMRWISPDPLAVHSLGADLNVYAYVHGAVFTAIDPVGLAGEPVDGGAPPMGAPEDAYAGQTAEPSAPAAPAAEQAETSKPTTEYARECPGCASFVDGLQIDASKLRTGLNINDPRLRAALGLPAERWHSPGTFPGYHVGKVPAQTETKHVFAIEFAPDNGKDFNAVFFSLDKNNEVVGAHFGSIGPQRHGTRTDGTYVDHITTGGLVSGDYQYTVGLHRNDKYHGNFAVLIVSGTNGKPNGFLPTKGPNNWALESLGQYRAGAIHVHSAMDGARASLGCLNIHNDQYADFLSHFGSSSTGTLTVVRYEDIRTFFPK
jgi:RHS repeat-associated protein